jgi:large subunit ribosomal protein L25
MEIATIRAETREPGTRNANERLRRNGQLPAVIYGHGEAPETVALSAHDVALAIEHTAHVVKLQIDGKETEYLIKEVQYDHLQRTPIHLDLMRVKIDEKVEVSVALELKGTAKGTLEGGVVVQQLNELQVECLLHRIPSILRLKIDELGMNESRQVKDVPLPEGVEVLNDPEDVVVVVNPPRIIEEPEEVEVAEGEQGAEPEVIGRERDEEESTED